MAKSRLVGDYPVIGIRPTIDGRRGALKVRESLEEQTMNMALSAKKLFEENLRYSNGEPVKVIIADTTIGRVGEAAACADKFKKAGVDITLTVTPCWCYGSETMDMDPNTIKGVWGFNGTERPGAVYLASVLASHAQKGLPAFGIYGHDVQNADETEIPDDVREKLIIAEVIVKSLDIRFYDLNHSLFSKGWHYEHLIHIDVVLECAVLDPSLQLFPKVIAIIHCQTFNVCFDAIADRQQDPPPSLAAHPALLRKWNAFSRPS